MNKELKSLVLSHALRVRQWAEDTNKRRKVPGLSCLNGWCAIASAKLWRELDAAGIKSELHLAEDGYIGCHVYLVVEDHVVDVTASQFVEFKNSRVLVDHHRMLENHWFYQSAEVFDSATELRKHQVRTGWPKDQTAYAA